MIQPTLEKTRKLAEGCTLVPIAMELFADIKTPVEVLRGLRAQGRECFLLESASGGEGWGRYTFLGFEPEMTIRGGERSVTVRGKDGVAEVIEGDPVHILKEVVAGYRSPSIPEFPPFTGGFVGYFAYEYIRHVESSLKLEARDDVGFDDFHLMLFRKIIAFDNFSQKIFLIVNIDTDAPEANYIEGVALLKDMERLVRMPSPEPAPEREHVPPVFTPSFERDDFCAAVEKVKRHIFEGDIFQCVPSVRFRAPYGDDLLGAYRMLRTTNPSAYMFYIRFDDFQIAGASPETLVSLRDGIAGTYPLAGTCPRTDDEEETKALIAQMLADEKELAEHDMLVDLGRNDLGKICRFGSVKLAEYRSVKKLSHVCHIASKVTGELGEGYDAPDVVAAVLPAGTLSGAPKLRACEIIDEAENLRRGPYGGAIGYIDFTGNLDLCIGIRMAVLKDGFVYVQAGAGIVADSVPEKEYEECLRKASAMMEALT
ncbi:MAG: chorismate-binding protein [Clostridiales Family XIII bacterium]|jgi:anthranilate synthase component 1|nr:chorismate-binding protein [Clostridiales Family XIII bacterium]